MKYCFFILLFIPLFLFSQQTRTTRILFILDASNSMNSTWDKQTRMEAAKEVLIKSIEQLRGVPNLDVALRVYGHQTPITNDTQDCQDTKLEVPFGPNNIDAIKNKVRSLQAKGATPIARSLEAAAADFPDSIAKNIIILITDGLESCDNDPCVIAKKLKEKGVKVTPFVIGLGMDLSYLEKFACIGTYSDAENKESFNKVLTNILTKVLVNTTVQINLNDHLKKPTETNVSMNLYEAGTNNLKYTFVHTINRYGNPDTLILDPSIKYDLVVHTLPKITKTNISIIKHMHNTINVDAPQGSLKFTAPNSSTQNGVLMRVMEKDKPQTINTQVFNVKDKYLIGTYDVEIFTLPRIIKRIEITQGKLSTIDVEAAGSLEFVFPKPMIAQLFIDNASGKREWVCNLDESSLKGKLLLQPGNYVLVCRDKDQKSTAYTKEKKFKIESNKIVLLNL